MTRTTQAIFKKALKLPLESRADLVELLLNSILEEDSSARKKVDAAWAKEAKDRFEAFLRGEIKAYPMDEVMNTLRNRHTP
jgi:putative addiction module component (TIGR02574 family)